MLAFNGRVKVILGKEFKYQPSAEAQDLFKSITRHTVTLGGNEYDAAVRVMLDMMNSYSGAEEISLNGVELVFMYAETIHRIIPRTVLQSDNTSMLASILGRIEDRSDVRRVSERGTDTRAVNTEAFNRWYRTFIAECGKLYPEFAADRNGVSILDDIKEVEGMRDLLSQHYEDATPPEVMAEILAPSLHKPIKK